MQHRQRRWHAHHASIATASVTAAAAAHPGCDCEAGGTHAARSSCCAIGCPAVTDPCCGCGCAAGRSAAGLGLGYGSCSCCGCGGGACSCCGCDACYCCGYSCDCGCAGATGPPCCGRGGPCKRDSSSPTGLFNTHHRRGKPDGSTAALPLSMQDPAIESTPLVHCAP